MRPLLLLAGPLAWIITSAAVGHKSPKPTELMPATTVFYAEGTDSQTLLQLPLFKMSSSRHSLRTLEDTRCHETARWHYAGRSSAGRTITRGNWQDDGWRLGCRLRCAHARFYVVVASARCDDLRRAIQRLLSIAENDAKSKGRELKQMTYREVDAYEVNGAVLARLEDYLVVCNKGELAKSLVDRWREPPANSDALASNQRFQEFFQSSQSSQPSRGKPSHTSIAGVV